MELHYDKKETFVKMVSSVKTVESEMTKEAFFQKIDKALEDIENDNNVVRFSPEEFIESLKPTAQ